MITTYNNKNGSKNQEPIFNYLIIFLISIVFISVLEKTKIINYLFYKINVNYIIFISFFVAVYNSIGEINFLINKKKILKIKRIKEKLIKKIYRKKFAPIILKKLDPILNSYIIDFKFKKEEEARTFFINIKKYNIEKLLKIVNNFTSIKIVKEEKEKKKELVNIISNLKNIREAKEKRYNIEKAIKIINNLKVVKEEREKKQELINIISNLKNIREAKEKRYNIEKTIKIISNLKAIKEEKRKKDIEITNLIRVIRNIEEAETISEVEAIQNFFSREEAEENEIKKIRKVKKIKVREIEEIEDYLKKPTEKKREQFKFISLMLNNPLVKVKNLNVGRLRVCGDYLLFLKSEKGGYRLKKANLCENRFCPLCSSIRARKNAVILLELLEYAREIEKKEFIFLTLTAPNVTGEKLEAEIKDFNNSFKKFVASKEITKICKGYIRKLEVTYNAEANTYHPHFHIIFAVNKSYFRSSDYLSVKKLLELWKKFKKDETITQVDIAKVRMNSIKEVLEMATYSAKASDLYDNGQEVFNTFYGALRGKQEITFGGIFTELKRMRDNGELVTENIESLKQLQEIAIKKVWHKWKKENKEYFKYIEQELTKEEQEKFYNLDLTNIKID